MKTFLRDQKNNSIQILIPLLTCVFGAIFDRLLVITINDNNLYTIGIMLVLMILSFVGLLYWQSKDNGKIHFQENTIRKQWEVYDLLNELQKRKMRVYLSYGVLSLLIIPLLFGAIIYYRKEELFYVIRTWWFAVPLCIVFLNGFTIWYLCTLYSYKIYYYDNSFAQILFKRIVELREQIKDNNLGAISDILDSEGNKKYYKILLELEDDKLLYNLPRNKTIKIVNAEIVVIEQLENILDKEGKDIKQSLLDKITRKLRGFIRTYKKENK